MKSTEKPTESTRDQTAEQEQKKVALSYLHEAWAEALLEGVDVDCMAQACLFAALSEMVSTYGEEAAARFTEGLAVRIHNGEFSVDLSRN
jgi:predicted YcjX-like family ATPase